jgi:hypothetical protein
MEKIRARIVSRREAAEAIKRAVIPQKAKKKGRRASEVGINILAESGTSLIRKSSDISQGAAPTHAKVALV